MLETIKENFAPIFRSGINYLVNFVGGGHNSNDESKGFVTAINKRESMRKIEVTYAFTEKIELIKQVS